MAVAFVGFTLLLVLAVLWVVNSILLSSIILHKPECSHEILDSTTTSTRRRLDQAFICSPGL